MLNPIPSPTGDRNTISSLPNQPKIGAAALKAFFDKSGKENLAALQDVVAAINKLIEILNTDGANQIGAASLLDEGTGTVQQKLATLKQYIDDAQLASGAADMLKQIYDTNNDGTVNTADRAVTADKAADSDRLGGSPADNYLKKADHDKLLGSTVATLVNGKLPAGQLTAHTHDVDSLGKVWRGTEAQWNALMSTQKAAYWLALVVE